MKIKLISPKMTLRPMDSEFKRVMSPSIALLILATLTPKEHEVYIEDENVGKLNLIVSKIGSFGLMNYLGKLARRLSYGID
jgi:hypothetical protein